MKSLRILKLAIIAFIHSTYAQTFDIQEDDNSLTTMLYEEALEPSPTLKFEPLLPTSVEVASTTTDLDTINSLEDYFYSCQPEDWSCKSDMTDACFQKVSECWENPHPDYNYDDCFNTIQICNNIWN